MRRMRDNLGPVLAPAFVRAAEQRRALHLARPESMSRSAGWSSLRPAMTRRGAAVQHLRAVLRDTPSPSSGKLARWRGNLREKAKRTHALLPLPQSRAIFPRAEGSYVPEFAGDLRLQGNVVA